MEKEENKALVAYSTSILTLQPPEAHQLSTIVFQDCAGFKIKNWVTLAAELHESHGLLLV